MPPRCTPVDLGFKWDKMGENVMSILSLCATPILGLRFRIFDVVGSNRAVLMYVHASFAWPTM